MFDELPEEPKLDKASFDYGFATAKAEIISKLKGMIPHLEALQKRSIVVEHVIQAIETDTWNPLDI